MLGQGNPVSGADREVTVVKIVHRMMHHRRIAVADETVGARLVHHRRFSSREQARLGDLSAASFRQHYYTQQMTA